jgi:hypothetical protein
MIEATNAVLQPVPDMHEGPDLGAGPEVSVVP